MLSCNTNNHLRKRQSERHIIIIIIYLYSNNNYLPLMKTFTVNNYYLPLIDLKNIVEKQRLIKIFTFN